MKRCWYLVALVLLSAWWVGDQVYMWGTCQTVLDQYGPVVKCGAPGCPAGMDCTPKCDPGKDCSPPVIQANSDFYRWDEPVYQWMDKCPRTGTVGSCWEAKTIANFGLMAADPSRVKEISAQVMIDYGDGLSEIRELKGDAHFQTGTGVNMTLYDAAMDITIYPTPGKIFSIRPLVTCAKDTLGNYGCQRRTGTATPPLNSTSSGQPPRPPSELDNPRRAS